MTSLAMFAAGYILGMVTVVVVAAVMVRSEE